MWGMANSHSPAWGSDCRCETVGLTVPCPGCLLDLLPLGKDLGCVIPLGNTSACSTASSVSSPSLSAYDCFSLFCFVFCSFVSVDREFRKDAHQFTLVLFGSLQSFSLPCAFLLRRFNSRNSWSPEDSEMHESLPKNFIISKLSE